MAAPLHRLHSLDDAPSGHAMKDATPKSAWLHRVAFRDFRNLARVDLAPPAEGIAIIGENGQGKTNLLEGIYYLQLLRSFRGARDRELVRFGEAGFHVSADVHGGRVGAVAVGFERAGKRKRVRLEGGEPERLTDALGSFPSVVFSPADVVLVSGAPSERRRYLDVVLALTSRPYLTALQRYRAALAQRNAVLRDQNRSQIEQRAAVWEPALAEHGALLWKARRDWVADHAASFSSLCGEAGERGESRLRYVSGVEDSADAAATLLESLERRRSHDVRRGLTHSGPHRDDIELTLDNHELRAYGSAGQQRTAAIALRLLEAATLRERTRTEPVVLLDDPFAELDTRRAARILELLQLDRRGQTFLAVPRDADIPADLTRLERWRIADGKLERDGAAA